MAITTVITDEEPPSCLPHQTQAVAKFSSFRQVEFQQLTISWPWRLSP